MNRRDKEVAYMERAFEYGDEGNYEQMVNYISMAIDCNPNDALYYGLRACALWELGYDRDAVGDSNRALSLDDTCAFAYYARGLVKLKYDGPEVALRDLELACRYEPDDEEFYNTMMGARNQLNQIYAERNHAQQMYQQQMYQQQMYQQQMYQQQMYQQQMYQQQQQQFMEDAAMLGGFIVGSAVGSMIDDILEDDDY